MDDDLKWLLAKWINQPDDLWEFMKDFANTEQMQWYLAMDGVVSNLLPPGKYCKKCISTDIGQSVAENPEDSGDVCNSCGSFDIE